MESHATCAPVAPHYSPALSPAPMWTHFVRKVLHFQQARACEPLAETQTYFFLWHLGSSCRLIMHCKTPLYHYLWQKTVLTNIIMSATHLGERVHLALPYVDELCGFCHLELFPDLNVTQNNVKSSRKVAMSQMACPFVEVAVLYIQNACGAEERPKAYTYCSVPKVWIHRQFFLI